MRDATEFIRDNQARILTALRRQRCPVCDRAMRHVPTDHLAGDTPPVFRCAEPGPEHEGLDLSPDCYWSTNGAQLAWYQMLDRRNPWLGWEQSTPGRYVTLRSDDGR